MFGFSLISERKVKKKFFVSQIFFDIQEYFLPLQGNSDFCRIIFCEREAMEDMNIECGMWSVECGVWSVEWSPLAMLND